MTSPIFSSLSRCTNRTFRITNWVARVLGMLMVALLVIAWWDESQARQQLVLGGATNPDFFFQWSIWTHFLPALALAIFTFAGWNRPRFAGTGFALFALLQAFTVGTELAYIPIVVAPGLIVAIAYATAYRWGMRDKAAGGAS